MENGLLLVSAILRAAGFRRGNQKRRSSRSKRWSRSAQTLFASWAVLGQLGGMGLAVGELLTVSSPVAANPGNPVPNSWGGPLGDLHSNNPNAHNSWGSMALGLAASAGSGTSNGSSIAIGTATNATH